MGKTQSRQRRSMVKLPDDERYFGLENFGNTCYYNAVLQALFFCPQFRQAILAQTFPNGTTRDTLLGALTDLFTSISNARKQFGSISPRKFNHRLRKDNEIFSSTEQQDAQEFLNFLLNHVSECISKQDSGPTAPPRDAKTWVHDIFEGSLTNETKCLTCETVRTREESFLDLSIDIEQNTSVTSCLRNFSSTETLGSDSKYFCETCCSEQEAQKRLRIGRLPQVLALHLKRFKYIEQRRGFVKLTYRVVFPFELRVFNTADETTGECEQLYELIGVVVHIGNHPGRGHYISIVKSCGTWLIFDDQHVEPVDDEVMAGFFGCTDDQARTAKVTSETAYLLFYQKIESRGAIECGARATGTMGGGKSDGAKSATLHSRSDAKL
eukprot:m.50072 g.50072  ORF g.50072 m.50072 type:complete len:382 (+) comp12122_c0_seq2:86-1231(+)